MNESASTNALGDRLHGVNSLAMQHWLGVLSDRDSGQRRVNLALRRIYELLWNKTFSFVMRREERSQQVITPMAALVGEENATVTMPILGSGNSINDRHIIVVNILSAGMVPAEVVRDRLLEVHPDKLVHMDHIGAERQTDERGHVTGTALGSFKSCNITNGAIFLAPDPMGATGSSAIATLERYRALEDQYGEVFSLFIFMHAIVAPEHLARIAAFDDPRVHVFAGRVDKGLTAKGYIVPGAGGLGERSNGRPMGK
ncbi:MAG: uracil phosphoribosyltransferase [bacterium]|nr:uracil phosphoribosyltransferase [bacterium]